MQWYIIFLENTQIDIIVYVLCFRLLGLNMWKWMIRFKRTGCTEILLVPILHMVLKDGLWSFKECARDLLATLLKRYLIMNMEEVNYYLSHHITPNHANSFICLVVNYVVIRLYLSLYNILCYFVIVSVISSIEGRRSVMKLSHRMVKIFCESLNMTGKLDFPQLTVENNSGVRVSVRKSTELGQPNGTIVIAATSLWLPLHYQKVFDFLTDVNKRVQVHKLAS